LTIALSIEKFFFSVQILENGGEEVNPRLVSDMYLDRHVHNGEVTKIEAKEFTLEKFEMH